MGARTAANSLVKRTTFSSAINILPNEAAAGAVSPKNPIKNDTDLSNNNPTKPYSQVPGPKGLPFIGNSWRFAPIIGNIVDAVEWSRERRYESAFSFPTGQYSIQDLDKVMYTLNKQFGNIAKVGGLIGHPDLLFVFDGDEIRKIFQKEETLPHRYSLLAFNQILAYQV